MITYEELRDAVDGFHAYDSGSVDSGIRDEALRQSVKKQMSAMPKLEHRPLLARLVIDLHLSTEALAQGYGPEDAQELLRWFDDQRILIAR